MARYWATLRECRGSRHEQYIERFGELALESQRPVHIAGRCTVFAESDMIHKQQTGHRTEDIVYGLCRALVRNYLNNVGLGKDIEPPIVFQGGVAFNRGIVKALREELGPELIVPPHHEVMGAIGAALLVHEEMKNKRRDSCFKGFGVSEIDYHIASFQCRECSDLCEIAQISAGGEVLAQWGGRCELGAKTKRLVRTE